MRAHLALGAGAGPGATARPGEGGLSEGGGPGAPGDGPPHGRLGAGAGACPGVAARPGEGALSESALQEAAALDPRKPVEHWWAKSRV